MFPSTYTEIRASNVKSLIWDGNDLVDWVAGGQRYRLSGETIRAYVNFAYAFDAAIASPSGDYVLIYSRLGTKGLLIRGGSIVREINRSFYCADVYECVAMLTIADGRELLAHCPEE